MYMYMYDAEQLPLGVTSGNSFSITPNHSLMKVSKHGKYIVEISTTKSGSLTPSPFSVLKPQRQNTKYTCHIIMYMGVLQHTHYKYIPVECWRRTPGVDICTATE